MAAKLGLIVDGAVVAAAVRVVDQARRRPADRQGSTESRQSEAAV